MSPLKEAYLQFIGGIRQYTEADSSNTYQRRLGMKEAEWGLRRLRDIAVTITPEAWPNVHPLYVHELEMFLESWGDFDAKTEARRWEQKEKFLANFLTIEHQHVEGVIIGIEQGMQGPDGGHSGTPARAKATPEGCIWLTITGVANYTGYTDRAVRDWVQGRHRPIEVLDQDGTNYLFRLADLDARKKQQKGN